MRPRISIRGSVHRSVRPSVCPSVGPSVTLSSKSRKIDILDHISVRGGLLDASSHLYKRVCPSICLSIHPSIHRLVTLSSWYNEIIQSIMQLCNKRIWTHRLAVWVLFGLFWSRLERILPWTLWIQFMVWMTSLAKIILISAVLT